MNELCLLVSCKYNRSRNSNDFIQNSIIYIYPTAFLTRFTVGVDSSTNLTWAVPTLGERHERGPGQGRYVAQNQQALNSFEKTGT
jgi:hypothetical protein